MRLVVPDKVSEKTSVQEGKILGRRLLQGLERINAKTLKRYRSGKSRRNHTGIALAAPQIGIYKRVVVVNELVLVNPIIVGESSVRIPFEERCLSFKGKKFDTWRYLWITVRADNHKDVITFGPTHPDNTDYDAICESAYAQNAIAYLQGLPPSSFLTNDYPPPHEWWRQQRANN